jgi:uncharacterized membrane protein YhfC
MNILFLTYLLNGFLMIAMPIGLGIFLSRKFELEWRLFLIGAGTFVLSQVGHLSFNWAITTFGLSRLFLPVFWQNVIYAGFIGLSAGVWEELARYAMYRWWAKDARSWSKALMIGTGHAGVEAVALGFLVLVTFVQLVSLRNLDLTQVVPADQLSTVQAQVAAYWSMPWYSTFLGAAERLFAIPAHLAMAVMVLQAFTRKKFWWVGLAVLFHVIWDGVLVYAAQSGLSSWGVEVIALIFALASLGIIFALRSPEPQPQIEMVPVPVDEHAFIPKTVEETIKQFKNVEPGKDNSK